MRTSASSSSVFVAAAAMLLAVVQPTTAQQATASTPAVLAPEGAGRLIWDQPAASAQELRDLGFLVFVDGRRQQLDGISCASHPGIDGFECSAALPALGAGVHAIELAAYMRDDGTEGGRSTAIRVRLPGSGPGPDTFASATPAVQANDHGRTTPAGVRLRTATVADGLVDPTAILPLPDGRLLVAERAGRVRIVRDGALLPMPGATLQDVTVGNGHGLLSLAAEPAFPTTGHVFALHTTSEGLRLVRFTVFGDRLVDRAVLLDGLPIAARQPAALLGSGPDGRLYLALDDGGDPEHLADLGSYSGKVLRLDTDGTTPDDQPGPSPVWSVGVRRPIGLAWSGAHATFRLVGVESPGSTAAGTSARAAGAGGPARPLSRFSIAPDTGASSATVVTGSAPSFSDNLLVASASGRAIFRIWFDDRDAPAGSEWLLSDLPGPVTAIAVAEDGTIYAAVGTTLLRVITE